EAAFVEAFAKNELAERTSAEVVESRHPLATLASAICGTARCRLSNSVVAKSLTNAHSCKDRYACRPINEEDQRERQSVSPFVASIFSRAAARHEVLWMQCVAF